MKDDKIFLYANKTIKYKKIKIGNEFIGDGNFQIFAGPCSIESKEQLLELGDTLKKNGCKILRAGAYKPRTSPYDFQGLGFKGLEYLLEARKTLKMPVVTELVDTSKLHLFDEIDVIQVGARNIQNYELLKELGKTRKPILLKRGFSSTIREFLLSAEYILKGGNENVILCERGIRTFENATRNTLDLSAVSILKKETHLPVIVDPSHATGLSSIIIPMSMAAVACGADGIMVEVHKTPDCALTDAAQAIDFKQFEELKKNIDKILPFAYSYDRD